VENLGRFGQNSQRVKAPFLVLAIPYLLLLDVQIARGVTVNEKPELVLQRWDSPVCCTLIPSRALAATARAGTIYLWDYTTGSLVRVIETRLEGITRLQPSIDGGSLVAIANHAAVIVDVSKAQITYERIPDGNISPTVLDVDQQYLVEYERVASRVVVSNYVEASKRDINVSDDFRDAKFLQESNKLAILSSDPLWGAELRIIDVKSGSSTNYHYPYFSTELLVGNRMIALAGMETLLVDYAGNKLRGFTNHIFPAFGGITLFNGYAYYEDQQDIYNLLSPNLSHLFAGGGRIDSFLPLDDDRFMLTVHTNHPSFPQQLTSWQIYDNSGILQAHGEIVNFEVTKVFFDPSSRQLLMCSANGGAVGVLKGNTWNPTFRISGAESKQPTATLSPDGSNLFVGGVGGVHCFDLTSGRLRWSQGKVNFGAFLAYSEQSGELLAASYKRLDVLSPKDGHIITNFAANRIVLDRSGRTFMMERSNMLSVISSKSRRALFETPASLQTFGQMKVSSSSNLNLISIATKYHNYLVDVRSRKIMDYGGADDGVLTVTEDGRFAVFRQSLGETTVYQPFTRTIAMSHGITEFADQHFVLKKTQTNLCFVQSGATNVIGKINAPHALYDQNFGSSIVVAKNIAVITYRDGILGAWRADTGESLFRMHFYNNGLRDSWIAVDDVGRFDTSDFHHTQHLRWRVSNAQDGMIPLESLTERYFEPYLIGNICQRRARRSVPDIKSVNARIPQVAIQSLTPFQSSNGNYISISVDIDLPKTSEGSCMGGAFDLHILRDGIAVSQFPDSEFFDVQSDAGWRRNTQIAYAPACRTNVVLAVRIPQERGKQSVEIGAYVFNEEKIKSRTAVRKASLNSGYHQSMRKRAFVISVGISKFQHAPKLRLPFAGNDADLFDSLLCDSLSRSNYDIVSIKFRSEPKSGQLPATKLNLKSVFSALSGRQQKTSYLSSIGILDSALPIRPGDVVLVYLSTHGFMKAQTLYVLPSDFPNAIVTDRNLTEAISSFEIGDWFNRIDSDSQMLVLDTCYSAGAFAFDRPAPLGARGLGQIAFNKQMTILAASQTEEEANESKKLNKARMVFFFRTVLIIV